MDTTLTTQTVSPLDLVAGDLFTVAGGPVRRFDSVEQVERTGDILVWHYPTDRGTPQWTPDLTVIKGSAPALRRA